MTFHTSSSHPCTMCEISGAVFESRYHGPIVLRMIMSCIRAMTQSSGDNEFPWRIHYLILTVPIPSAFIINLVIYLLMEVLRNIITVLLLFLLLHE